MIPFGNRVYHFPKSVSFNEKRPRKPETNIQKRFEDMKSELAPGLFTTRKIGECLLKRSVCFRNFPLKRRKQPEIELMVSLTKYQSVCFNRSKWPKAVNNCSIR